MSSVLENVNRRTQMVGQNRLELLLFRLHGRQIYGINVFKVQEVIQCPSLTRVPQAHHVVRGIANMRGKTISVIDLSQAVGGPPLEEKGAYVIITEFNRTILGFLVGAVENIVNLNWDTVLAPPKGGDRGYLTAVTRVGETLVEILDVEKVLSEVIGQRVDPNDTLIENGQAVTDDVPREILVADDSSVARNQIKRTMAALGIKSVLCNDGREALNLLRKWSTEGTRVSQRLLMVISDIEMPEMDGYTLVSELRHDPELQDLWVLLHSSLSGGFNKAMVEKVGANHFIPKYNPDDLAQTAIARMEAFGKKERK